MSRHTEHLLLQSVSRSLMGQSGSCCAVSSFLGDEVHGASILRPNHIDHMTLTVFVLGWQGIRVEVNGQVLSQGGNLNADRITDTTSRVQMRSNPDFLPAAVIVGLQPGLQLQARSSVQNKSSSALRACALLCLLRPSDCRLTRRATGKFCLFFPLFFQPALQM